MTKRRNSNFRFSPAPARFRENSRAHRNFRASPGVPSRNSDGFDFPGKSSFGSSRGAAATSAFRRAKQRAKKAAHGE